VVVALVAGILLGTIFSGNLFSPQRVSNPNHGGDANTIQGVAFAGNETLKVLGPDGQVVSTWKGPDPLTVNAINAIAACLVGQTGEFGVSVFQYCPTSGSTWIQQIEIDFGSGCTWLTSSTYSGGCGVSDAIATNTLTLNGQAGCDPSSSISTDNCNGWITEATFGPATFTTTNCPTTCPLQNVQTQLIIGPGPNGPGGAAFDYLCTSEFGSITVGTSPEPCTLSSSPATMSPGDSLLVTILFTVS